MTNKITRIKFSTVSIPSYEEINVKTVFSDINKKNFKFEGLKEILKVRKEIKK